MKLELPPELPISTHAGEIGEALGRHQVVVVCGETGSGKTTQLPKICLQAGRGSKGRIGHTQPRRIAARSVAERIAQEVGCSIGAEVGYQMRFADKTSKETVVKVMTDGILLNEIHRDRNLRQYDTLILDEAHERSLNVDFLLGYLKRLLKRRRDLRLVVTSATIHPEEFSEHFDGAPIVEVSGRGYPIETRYRPLDDESQEMRPLPFAILEEIEALWREHRGDVLVFLPGEGEIRETCTLLQRRLRTRAEVLPLFARLAADEQQKIFEPGRGNRIVVATNIAETSITVPGIRYVVDSGLARISRYNSRTKVQRLPVERISQASAQQRAGRCGRVGPGVCVRLYDEEDFDDRDAFTPPEVQRTNLASVILQMKVMGLGDVRRFPFLDPPDTRAITDGLRLLRELEALDTKDSPTPIGRALVRFPLDPRVGRMLLAARDENCLDPVLVIASALSVQDPRVRPAGNPGQADEAHRPFADSQSDFYGFLKLWNHFEQKRRELSRSALREHCAAHHLSLPRLWEWRDVHRQLRQLCRESPGFEVPQRKGIEVDFDKRSVKPIHKALLAGLLSHVGQRDAEGSEYRGAAGKTFHLFPGSGLFKKRPPWVVAAELVETTRLYARVCAKVDPAWIEAVAGHLIKRSYTDPFWDERQGRVLAMVKVSLDGLILSADGVEPYEAIDPGASRGIFIAQGLVPGRVRSRAPFLLANRELLRRLEGLEDKARRRGLVIGDDVLYQFYDERIPDEAVSLESFDTWRSKAERRDPELLFFDADDLMARAVGDIDAVRFPDRWADERGLDFELRYRFEPGHPEDGVTVHVPLAALADLRPEPFEWLVPGRLPDKVLALLRALPKRLRRTLLPLQATADSFLDQRDQRLGSLDQALKTFLTRRLGDRLPDDLWPHERLSADLLMRFEIVDPEGEPVAAGRDLTVLQQELSAQLRSRLEELPAPPSLDRTDIRAWDFGELPLTREVELQGVHMERFPTLVDRGESIDLSLCDDPQEAEAASRRAVARLLLLALPQQAQLIERSAGDAALRLRWAELPPRPWALGPRFAEIERLEDELLLSTAIGALPGTLPRQADDFYEIVESVRPLLVEKGDQTVRLLRALLESRREILETLLAVPDEATRADVEAQLARLLYKGSLTDTPPRWLRHFPRFVRALETRLTKRAENPEREAQRLSEIQPLWASLLQRLESEPAGVLTRPTWQDVRFLHEELRVSVFAQELRTSVPVSPKRIAKAWERLEGAR